jgi:hypothetical protein
MERRHFLIAWVYGLLYAIFPSLRPKPIEYVTTTYAQIGETQEFTMEYAIGWHPAPEPMCFILQGNAWTLSEKTGTKVARG